MAEMADAFVALPGGSLDVEGYFAPLLAFVERAVGDGFIRPPYRELFVVSATVDGLLDALARHIPPPPIVSWLRAVES
jgi:predicted Rossmann-fold nucleotide-binding protein